GAVARAGGVFPAATAGQRGSAAGAVRAVGRRGVPRPRLRGARLAVAGGRPDPPALPADVGAAPPGGGGVPAGAGAGGPRSDAAVGLGRERAGGPDGVFAGGG